MIKRYLFLIVAVLHMMTYTMELDTKVKLPSAEELKKSFDRFGLGGFACETKIHEYLANKEMSIGLLHNTVDTFRAQYLEQLYKVISEMQKYPDLLKKENIWTCIVHRISVVEEIDNSSIYDGLTRTMHALKQSKL